MAKRGLFRARHELFRGREHAVNVTVYVCSQVAVSSLNEAEEQELHACVRASVCARYYPHQAARGEVR